MLLYHGSNVPVRQPRLLESNRRTDFGSGFYLTSNFEQARRWSVLRTERSGDGVATVSVFEISETAFNEFNVLKFEKADARWLKYVVSNRIGRSESKVPDVVIGPVANDKTMPTLARFMLGELSQSETLRRLRTQVLSDQFAFRTERALSELKFKKLETP